MTFLILSIVLAQPVAPVVGKADRPPPAPWVEVKADAILTVLTAPEKSQWLLIDDGADLVPSADGRTAAFAAPAKGRYRVVVVGPLGEPSRVVVVVGDAAKPPTPVPIDPPAPVPTDPLTAKLQAAYRLDTRDAAKKSHDLADLIELYKQASEFAGKADIVSFSELIVRVKDAAKMLGIEGLADLRKSCAEELKLAFPLDAAFDDGSRAKAKALFLKLSEALKNVK